jgi:16S rRNA C967 or C1407 C5-methylase (RsmB/RsmF family)
VPVSFVRVSYYDHDISSISSPIYSCRTHLLIQFSFECPIINSAPGSKTSQLLEIISNIPDGELEPKGYVVANDSDAKRAYMLVHQLRRINSPAVFVTAKDAQFWPMLLRGRNVTDEERANEGMFDRVLCDVPCSGDGTARKNPGIWKHWTASSAHSLHPLQTSIALNGARLTKVGGYVCYSTCSMNPIENEAVVAEILRSTDGSLELVDKRPDLPGIVAREGWSDWKVLGESKSRRAQKNYNKKNNENMKKRRKDWEEKEKLKNGGGDVDVSATADEDVEMNSAEEKEEVPEEPWEPIPPSWDEESLMKRAASRGLIEYKTHDDVPFVSRQHIRKSCFPPTPEEAEKFKLDRCIRCLPHDLDTGGFFVALFKKVSPMSARSRKKAEELANAVASKLDHTTSNKTEDGKARSSEIETKETEEETNAEDSGAGADAETPAVDPKKKRSYGFSNAESFVAAEGIFAPLADFYGFTDDLQEGQFMARAGSKSKLLYFITKSVKKNLIDRGVQDRVQVINSGLRAFERRNKNDSGVE